VLAELKMIPRKERIRQTIMAMESKAASRGESVSIPHLEHTDSFRIVRSDNEETQAQRDSEKTQAQRNSEKRRSISKKKHRMTHLDASAALAAIKKHNQAGPAGKNEQGLGSMAFYSETNIRKRESLRHHPLIVKILKVWWNETLSEFDKDNSETIGEEEYIALHERLVQGINKYQDLGATIEDGEAHELARKDWIEDSHGEGDIDDVKFFDSIFQLADQWCATLEVKEYVDFLVEFFGYCYHKDLRVIMTELGDNLVRYVPDNTIEEGEEEEEDDDDGEEDNDDDERKEENDRRGTLGILFQNRDDYVSKRATLLGSGKRMRAQDEAAAAMKTALRAITAAADRAEEIASSAEAKRHEDTRLSRLCEEAKAKRWKDEQETAKRMGMKADKFDWARKMSCGGGPFAEIMAKQAMELAAKPAADDTAGPTWRRDVAQEQEEAKVKQAEDDAIQGRRTSIRSRENEQAGKAAEEAAEEAMRASAEELAARVAAEKARLKKLTDSTDIAVNMARQAAAFAADIMQKAKFAVKVVAKRRKEEMRLIELAEGACAVVVERKGVEGGVEGRQKEAGALTEDKEQKEGLGSSTKTKLTIPTNFDEDNDKRDWGKYMGLYEPVGKGAVHELHQLQQRGQQLDGAGGALPLVNGRVFYKKYNGRACKQVNAEKNADRGPWLYFAQGCWWINDKKPLQPFGEAAGSLRVASNAPTADEIEGKWAWIDNTNHFTPRTIARSLQEHKANMSPDRSPRRLPRQVPNPSGEFIVHVRGLKLWEEVAHLRAAADAAIR
jgi:hypothetical protein